MLAFCQLAANSSEYASVARCLDLCKSLDKVDVLEDFAKWAEAKKSADEKLG